MRIYNHLLVTALIFAGFILFESSYIEKNSRQNVIENEEKVKPYKLSWKEKRQGFKILFDGTNMDNWIDNTDQYVIEDGILVMRPKANNGGNLYTKEEYQDFVLRFEFLLTPGANNGLGIRHKYSENPLSYDGMELQILDDYDPKYKDLLPYQYHGSLYHWVPAKRGFLKHANEWNYQEVVMNDNHLQIILNGEIILDTNFNELVKNAPSDKDVSKLLYPKGHIAFLGHGDVVKFRNIRIKRNK